MASFGNYYISSFATFHSGNVVYTAIVTKVKIVVRVDNQRFSFVVAA